MLTSKRDQVQLARGNLRATMLPAPLGGCTALTPRCADASSYQADLRECCRGHITRLVAETVAGLDALGVTWWADYGTLLGAVRNPLLGLPPGIIPHDKDADLCFLWDDMAKVLRLRPRLQALGFQFIVRMGFGSIKVRLSALNHTNVDLFAWRTDGHGMMHRIRYIQVDTFKGREFPRQALFPLGTVPWEGLTLRAPRDPAAFCAFRYGDSWQTPIRANHAGVRR